MKFILKSVLHIFRFISLLFIGTIFGDAVINSDYIASYNLKRVNNELDFISKERGST
jgi:hypothetical protein